MTPEFHFGELVLDYPTLSGQFEYCVIHLQPGMHIVDASFANCELLFTGHFLAQYIERSYGFEMRAAGNRINVVSLAELAARTDVLGAKRDALEMLDRVQPNM